jgi:hypothetical protein
VLERDAPRGSMLEAVLLERTSSTIGEGDSSRSTSNRQRLRRPRAGCPRGHRFDLGPKLGRERLLARRLGRQRSSALSARTASPTEIALPRRRPAGAAPAGRRTSRGSPLAVSQMSTSCSREASAVSFGTQEARAFGDMPNRSRYSPMRPRQPVAKLDQRPRAPHLADHARAQQRVIERIEPVTPRA